jgi:Spy/CpxP family protein refolding chaperone
MSDHTNPGASPTTAARPKRWYRPRNLIIATAVVLTAGVAGAFVSNAVRAQGYGWHGGMMGGHFGRGFSRFDPAAIEDRIDRAVRHVGIEIDATAEQQDKLRAIAKSAVKDLVPMRAKVDAAHERSHGLLVAPTVSRGDIETLRTEHMALADAFTKRVALALGDASEVLTPEQRKKLDALIAARRGFMHGGRRG